MRINIAPNRSGIRCLTLCYLLLTWSTQLIAEESRSFELRGSARREAAREQYPELPLKLVNPLARAHLLPISYNYLEGSGIENDGEVYSTTFSPRVPVTISDSLHLLLKSEISWMRQRNVYGNSKQEGWSDMKLSAFITPEHSTTDNIYWGVGPSFILPTASHDLLGTDKWSAGPSVGVFRQDDTWTAGVILTHVWDFAGDEDALDVNISRMQPLIAYTTNTATTLSLSSDSFYDYENEYWSVPVQFRISQLTLIRKHPMQFSLAARYFLTDREYTPDWGLRLEVIIPIETSRFKRLKKALRIKQ